MFSADLIKHALLSASIYRPPKCLEWPCPARDFKRLIGCRQTAELRLQLERGAVITGLIRDLHRVITQGQNSAIVQRN